MRPSLVHGLSFGVKSWYRLEAFKPVLNAYGEPLRGPDGLEVEQPGSRRLLADWFPNSLLTSGRNQMSTRSDWFNCCQVGTNNTTPTAGDTGLLGYVYGVNQTYVVENSFGAQASAPYYGWKQKKWRFPVGVTAANLSEVGVGWGTTEGATLLTRALIVDSNGDPTTVTPLSDEILDVTCQFRYYPPLVDVTGQVTLNGVVYDYTCRASDVTNSTAWGSHIGEAVSQISVTNGDWSAWDGTLGDITQGPNGTSAACDNSAQYNVTYVNNSYQQKMGSMCGINGWNLGGGIRCISFPTTAGNYQTQFVANVGGATIPKDVNYTMQMEWIIGWQEQVIP